MTLHWPRMIFVVALIGTLIAAILPAASAPTFGGSDKLNHIAAFITLSVLAAWAWPRIRLWWIAVLMSAIGGMIELVQAMPIVARDAEWADWYADTLAAVATLAIVAVFRGVRQR